MEKIIFSAENFNVKDTLECGQIFRFRPFGKGFLVFSLDKSAYCYNENGLAIIECEPCDKDYFYNFFDLDRDYAFIADLAIKSSFSTLQKSASAGKGIRILNQDSEEMLFSFIFSQNNNIPRIKSSIEKLCAFCGEKKCFMGVEYFTFPTANAILSAGKEIINGTGIGYRTDYVLTLAQSIVNGFDVKSLNKLPTAQLREKLISIKGVGEKVANCVTLFGYHRSDSFPVDTWIEKVYREDFSGALTDRKKITEFFLHLFGENAGYYQQYLFYYKRSLEKLEKR